MHLLILIVLCLVLGFVLGRMGRLPKGAPQVINAWVIDVALPALVLVQIPRLHLEPALLFAAFAAWLVFCGAWVLMPILGRVFGWERGVVGALILTCGLGNTAFMGYPLIEWLRGKDALGIAVIADQLGTFLALSTVAILVAASYSHGRPTPRELAMRVLRFPPFLALLAGFAVFFAGGWPPIAEKVLQRLADTMTPLALFSVGLQFRLGALKGYGLPVTLGLGWKMALVPALVWGLGKALGEQGLTAQVAVMQAGMGPMITAGVLSEQHGLAPPVAVAIVGLGTLLALLTVPAWALLLGP